MGHPLVLVYLAAVAFATAAILWPVLLMLHQAATMLGGL